MPNHQRYAYPVAATSATGFGRPSSTRRSSAHGSVQALFSCLADTLWRAAWGHLRVRRWVGQALANAREPATLNHVTVPINTDPNKEPTIRLKSEEALYQLIGTKRFSCTMEHDGRLLIREIEAGAFTMKPENLPSWIRDPAGCPSELLPELLIAISQRMGGKA